MKNFSQINEPSTQSKTEMLSMIPETVKRKKTFHRNKRTNKSVNNN